MGKKFHISKSILLNIFARSVEQNMALVKKHGNECWEKYGIYQKASNIQHLCK